ncbi:unnamed protein product [Absidia cylindrospora]
MKPRIFSYLLLWCLLTTRMQRLIDAAPQNWHSDLVDELTIDEWPVSGDDRGTPVDILGQGTIQEEMKHDFIPSTDSGGDGSISNQHQGDMDGLYALSGIKGQSSSRLQQQEEQDLEQLDQSILGTLQHAIDTTQENQPIRVISIEEATSRLLQSYSRWTMLTSHWTFSFVLLGMMMAAVTISVFLMIKKTKKSKHWFSRDYHPHHLPSFTVCKQKSSVD